MCPQQGVAQGGSLAGLERGKGNAGSPQGFPVHRPLPAADIHTKCFHASSFPVGYRIQAAGRGCNLVCPRPAKGSIRRAAPRTSCRCDSAAPHCRRGAAPSRAAPPGRCQACGRPPPRRAVDRLRAARLPYFLSAAWLPSVLDGLRPASSMATPVEYTASAAITAWIACQVSIWPLLNPAATAVSAASSAQNLRERSTLLIWFQMDISFSFLWGRHAPIRFAPGRIDREVCPLKRRRLRLRRHVRLVQRPVIGYEDTHPVPHLHAQLVVGEQRAAGLAVGDVDLGQQAKALA